MITATLRLEVPPQRMADALGVLRSLLGPISAQPGCAGCGLYSDVRDENVVLFVEEWGSREHLDRHLRSDHFRRILAAMEIAARPPELRFDTVSERQGLELVEAVRKPDAEAQAPSQPAKRRR